MHALLALSYADRRTFVNMLRALRRSPGRLMLWTAWLAVIVGLGWLRTTSHAPGGARQLGGMMDDALACSALLGLGLLLAIGPRALAGFFGSRTEALMLTRAPQPPALIAAYLQVRRIGLTLVQTMGRFVFLMLLVFSVRTTAGELLRQLALLAAAIVALASVPLPRALARGAVRAACIAAGILLAGAALLPMLRDALLAVPSAAALRLAERIPAWHPGAALVAAAQGDPRPIAALLLVAAVACAIFVAVARDAFPELYALSIAHIEHREVLAARRATRGLFGGDAARPGAPRRIASGRVPLHGAAALVWLDAVSWARRIPPGRTILIGAGCFAAGAVVGVLARAAQQPGAAAALFAALPQLYIAYASTGGVRLAADARKPLFWLGDARLWARLAAWSLAPLWRDAALLALLASGYGLLARDPATALTIAIGGLAVAMLTRAIGPAIVALLPNPVDQRGPATFVRLAVAYALIVPPASIALMTGLAAHAPVSGALAALAASALEALLLLVFAASRLAGRIDRLSSG